LTIVDDLKIVKFVLMMIQLICEITPRDAGVVEFDVTVEVKDVTAAVLVLPPLFAVLPPLIVVVPPLFVEVNAEAAKLDPDEGNDEDGVKSTGGTLEDPEFPVEDAVMAEVEPGFAEVETPTTVGIADTCDEA
jgi:hypothetical protein